VLRSVRFPAAAIAAAALLLTAGCGSSYGSQPPSHQSRNSAATHGHSPSVTVKIIALSNGKYAFSPAKVTIKAGGEVIWHNTTQTDHTVTTTNSHLQIQDIPPGSKAHLTFKKAGVVKYHCSFHPYMHGQVTVKK